MASPFRDAAATVGAMPKTDTGDLKDIAALYQQALAVQDAEVRRLLSSSVARVGAAESALGRSLAPRDPRDTAVVEALVDQARASAAAVTKGVTAALRGKPNAATASKIAAEAIAAEAIAAEAIAAEAVAAEPVAAEPVAAEPLAAEPLAAEPLAAEPLAAEPLAAEPLAAEPIAAEPIAAEPIAAEPIAAEPIAAEPIAAEPIAAEPLQAVNGDLLSNELGAFLSKHGNPTG